MLKHLCLRVQHTLARTEILQVALTDVRDHTDIRIRDLPEPVHLPEIGNSHLQNRDLMLTLDPEDRQRKTDLVIEILLRLPNLIFPGKDGSDHLLRTRLSDASRYPDHRNPKTSPVIRRNLLHRIRRRRYQNIRKIGILLLLLRKRRIRAAGQCIRDKAVSVHLFPGDRHKQIPRLYIPVISHNPRQDLGQNLLRSVVGSPADIRRDLHRKSGHFIVPLPTLIMIERDRDQLLAEL